MKKLLTAACLFVATVVAMSCGYPTPTPISVSEGPPARIDWLLGPGALLNAVHLTEAGAGAAVGEHGAILVTSDAGVTWTTVESGTDKSLRGVAFADGVNGVAVGAGGTVLRTQDAGRSWAVIITGLTEELRGVAFSGPDVGVIVGESGAVLRSVDAGRVWQPVVRGTASTLRAVRSATPSVAVAAGDGGTLLRSTDGGVSWSPVVSPTSAALRGLHFISASTGVAVGGDDRRWRSERVVLRTTDGGVTWTEIDAPKGTRLYSVAGAVDGSIVAVGEAGASIRSSDEGLTWQAAEPVKMTSRPNSPESRWDTSSSFASVSPSGPALVAVTYGGRIFRSTDAGAEWASAHKIPDAEIVGSVARAGDALVIGTATSFFRSADGSVFEKSDSKGRPGTDIHFFDPLVGVSVGFEGTIQRTIDGGKTWATIESGTKRILTGVAFSDDKQGIAVGNPAGTGPRILRTEDGGLTWHEQPYELGANVGFADVAMLPSQIGMAVGGWGGLVLKTTDGGRSWMQLKPDLPLTNVILISVALLDADTAVVVGMHGNILRTSDGGATWTRRESGTLLELRGVAFADASRGMIVGRAGTILTTTDGGLTWRRELSGTTRDLRTVKFDSSDTAIITGSPQPGILLRYTWTATREPQLTDTKGGANE